MVNVGKFKPQGNSFPCTVIKICVESVATGSKLDHSSWIKHEEWLVAVFTKNETGKAFCFVAMLPLFV